MNRFAPYLAASGCMKYGPAGGQAFTTYTEDVFAELHRLMGICNCRSVRGGASWSHHAECRAVDNGFTIQRGEPWGYRFALIIAEKAWLIGCDHIITNAEPWRSDRGRPLIFSARSPNGRTYTGAHPHKDHNHTGFTRNAGRHLTYQTIVSVYGRPEEVAARLLLDRTTGDVGDMLYGLDIGKQGDASLDDTPAHRVLQAFLVAQGYDLGTWGDNGDGVDGRPGGDTRTALHDWKIANGITAANSAGEGKIGTYEMAAIYAAGRSAGPDLSRLATKTELAAHAQNPDAHHA